MAIVEVLLPNGVAVVGRDWNAKNCGLPSFPHQVGQRGKQNKQYYQREMKKLQDHQPTNFIRWGDKDKYEGWGFRVIDVWGPAAISRAHAQFVKVRYEASDFHEDNFVKTVYRHLPVDREPTQCVGLLSTVAQERLISETFRVEVVHVVKPAKKGQSGGDTDFDRDSDIQDLKSRGFGEEKSGGVLNEQIKIRGGLQVIAQCSVHCGAKPQTLCLPRLPGDSMEKLGSREFLYEFSRWPGRYLIQHEYVGGHLIDAQHYLTCAGTVCHFCATGGRMGSGDGARWLSQSPRFCHFRHQNLLVNMTENPDYHQDQAMVEVRSVAIPPDYEASPDPTLSGALRYLGNVAAITCHCAQMILQDAGSQCNSGPDWIRVKMHDGSDQQIHKEDIVAVEGGMVRWNMGAQGSGSGDRYEDQICRLLSLGTLPAGPINRQVRSNGPLPSYFFPHPSGGPYRTAQTVEARKKLGERDVAPLEQRDPWCARTSNCPEILPSDLGNQSLERYKNATTGGATRAGDSYDIGASLWDKSNEQLSALADGVTDIEAVREAAIKSKTGAVHGFQDWPIFTSGDAAKTEPEGLPDFRGREA